MIHKSLYIRKYLWIIAALVLSVLLVSCRDDETKLLNDEATFLTYAVQDPPAETEVSTGEESIRVAFSPGVTDATSVVPEFEVSAGAMVKAGGALQTSGVTAHSMEGPFSYQVTSEDGQLTVEWRVVPRNNDYTESWGLGGFLKESVSNDRAYDFYIDQGNTGIFSRENCAPTVTVMAARWYDRDFSGTPQGTRHIYHPDGGGWYTYDIDHYLTSNHVPHYFIELSLMPVGTQTILWQKLQEGNIIILCLDMYYLSRSKEPEWRVDKFYDTDAEGWGHCLLAKGCKLIDRKVFIEVHDPYCYGKTYNDGTLKGKNRYYRVEEIAASAKKSWNYAIVISPHPLKADAADAVPAGRVPVARLN